MLDSWTSKAVALSQTPEKGLVESGYMRRNREKRWLCWCNLGAQACRAHRPGIQQWEGSGEGAAGSGIEL